MNNISTGVIPNPYREFIYNINPGETVNIKYDHSISEILDCNLPDNIEICYGYSGGFTPVQPGVSYQYPDNAIIPNIQIRNTDEHQVMTIRIYLAIGYVKDNRLNISGTVTVQTTAINPVYVSDVLLEQANVQTITLNASGTATFTPPVGTKKILIQNTGSENIIVMGGFVIAPLGTFEVNYAGLITFSGSSGNTVVIGVFS